MVGTIMGLRAEAPGVPYSEGIAMFGFFGIILGPVLMILIVTTISVYLAVFKGVAMEEADADGHKKRFGRKKKTAPLPEEVQPVVPSASGEPATPTAL